MTGKCNIDGCTVIETGRCALEKDPDTCENRVWSADGLGPDDEAPGTSVESSDILGSDGVVAPVLPRPVEVPSLPRSTTLSLGVIEGMMSSRYMTIVGILGDPDSGKTACLASLYLLVSNAQLEGWTFAKSESLMGFEEIARGARRWNEGNPPEQMTVHTKVDDERTAGFLHLKLRRESDGKVVDLALPDLPGEWTKSLIRTARSDRLEFIKSADVIWVILDGTSLTDRERRQGAITRLGQLVGRLRSMVADSIPRLLLVITRRDKGSTKPDTLQRIADELQKHNLAAEVIPVAPFSEDGAIKPGFGLVSLIESTVQTGATTPQFWPTTVAKVGGRCFLAFRTGE